MLSLQWNQLQKSFICSAFKTGWSCLLPISGLMEKGKGNMHSGCDKREFLNRRGPKALPGFPHKGVPCRAHIWRKRPELTRWNLSVPNAINISLRWYLLCSPRDVGRQGFPESFWFLISQDTARAKLHWAPPMCQVLYQEVQSTKPSIGDFFPYSQCPRSLSYLRTFACAVPASYLQFLTHTQLCKSGSFSSLISLLQCHLLLGVFHKCPRIN